MQDINPIKRISDKLIYVPEHVYELIADDVDFEIDENNNAEYSGDIENLCELLIKYYSAENWYPLLENTDLTPKSVLIPISRKLSDLKNNEKLLEAIKKFPKPFFVKLSSVSPKDVDKSLIVNDINDIYSLFTQSQRVKRTLYNDRQHYIFLRKVLPDCRTTPEFRVFVSNSKCVAITRNNIYVSQEHEKLKNKLIEFCDNIIKLTMYIDCTLDVVYYKKNNKFYLIEINTPFYLLAGTGLYDEKLDYDILSGKVYNELKFCDLRI